VLLCPNWSCVMLDRGVYVAYKVYVLLRDKESWAVLLELVKIAGVVV